MILSADGLGVCGLLLRLAQGRPWFAGQRVEFAENQFAIQPLEDVCEQCGDAVLSTGEDPEAVLRECRVNRMRKAEIIILSEIRGGNIPKDFRARLVKTSTSVGQLSYFTQTVVRRDRFNDVLKHYPEAFGGNSAPDAVFTYFDGEGDERRGVAISDKEAIDARLQPEKIDMFHRTKTTIVEYHLEPRQHIVSDQANREWASQTQRRIHGRSTILRREHCFRAHTFGEWQKKVAKLDDGAEVEDQRRKAVEAGLSDRTTLAATAKFGGFSRADSGESLYVRKESSKPADRPFGARRSGGISRGNSSGSLGAKGSSANRRSRSPPPRAPTTRKLAGGGSATKPRIGVRSAANMMDDDDLDVELDGSVAAGKKRTGRSYQHKEFNPHEALWSPDGGKLGRSLDAVLHCQ